MKKTTTFGLLSLMVFLGGCFGSENKDIVPTASLETENSISTGMLSGDNDFSGTIYSGSGTPQKTQDIRDLVGTTIPQDKDTELFLSSYLTEEGLSGYVIEKQLSKGDITTISMKQNNDNHGCFFESGGCIVFILRNNDVIWENATSLIKDLAEKNNGGASQGHGRFYRYTDHGVLLELQNGEGLGCVDGITYTYQYVHLKDLKTLWTTLDVVREGISPYPKDERCESPKTIWKEIQTLRFFSSYEDIRHHEKALPIKAKTTEEAFYKYYDKK